MATLIHQDTDGSLRSLDLGFRPQRIGRAPDNDLVIDHASVSLHHCEVALSEGGVTVRDLHSTNGTWLDGAPVTEPVTVRGSHVLRLGMVELRVEHTEVEVVIPRFATAAVPPILVAPGTGKRVCQKHQDRPAMWQCPQCHRLICPVCIHRIKLQRGRTHYLCPECSRPAELLPEFQTGRRRSLLRRLAGGVTRSARAFKKFLKAGPS